MDVSEAIATRRSVRQFIDQRVSRAEIERILDAAVRAPNHRMTQPWRFHVLGPEARRAYAAVLGARKATRIEDPEAARAVIEKVTSAAVALPAQIAVSIVLAESPEVREEDYAATMMAVQNMLLTAHAMGLGSHVKTGAVMEDPRAREALGVPDGMRIVALIDLGAPAQMPEPKPRRTAAELTSWLP
jgi:nitroreductase